MPESTTETSFRIAGHPFDLKAEDVLHAVRNVDPEPIVSHYVVVGVRRFPPKQAIGEVTGLDRADFTTHQALRTLMRLGFVVGRRSAGGGSSAPSNGATRATDRLVDSLRPLAGRWVAIKDDDLLHSADTLQDLVGWLARHDQRADSVFRVPEGDATSSGLAPL